MKFVVLKHTQPAKQVPFPRRRYLEMMADPSDRASDKLAIKLTDDQNAGGSRSEDVHYDLMLESDEGLLTWAMGRKPQEGKSCGAIKLPLHRALYLTHEGAVSEGRGTVKRVLQGEYEFVSPKRLLLTSKQQSLIVEMDEIQPDHFRFSFSSS